MLISFDKSAFNEDVVQEFCSSKYKKWQADGSSRLVQNLVFSFPIFLFLFSLLSQDTTLMLCNKLLFHFRGHTVAAHLLDLS